jgi:3-oxoacyl-[acyl-carrier protein] reductase/2-hydroxycyclohexanecarboxyl-CoA dehydrogenase
MLHKLTEADWDTVIDVNLKGTFLCMQQAAIRMRERGAGRISISLPPAGLATSGKPTIRRQKPAWWE